jgi:hypothetical protein
MQENGGGGRPYHRSRVRIQAFLAPGPIFKKLIIGVMCCHSIMSITLLCLIFWSCGGCTPVLLVKSSKVKSF